jgi:hypothetical protein
MTLRQLHRLAVRNARVGPQEENAWFRWWLFRSHLTGGWPPCLTR